MRALQVLAAGHLDGSVFQFLQFPETIPGVIVKKPDAAVKGRSAPGLDGEETYAVNGPGERSISSVRSLVAISD